MTTTKQATRVGHYEVRFAPFDGWGKEEAAAFQARGEEDPKPWMTWHVKDDEYDDSFATRREAIARARELTALTLQDRLCERIGSIKDLGRLEAIEQFIKSTKK
jgi:hypothetical protein